MIAAPGTGVVGLDQMSMARDGTGALVYTADVGGVAHVFVSRLLNGSFQPPQLIDAGLLGPSSQPVIAAGNGGLLLVAFINAGQLYVAEAASAAVAVGPPAVLASGAANPSLSISPSATAYLAFTSTASGQDVVDFAQWQTGVWSLGSGPVDATATEAAGAGTDRPQVVACGDGIGIVVWGEGGHVYARRLVGTTPSVQTLQADPPTVAGFSEVAATDPVIASVGFSTYAAVAFTEETTSGTQTQQRVIFNRLHGGQFDGASIADAATTGGPEGADQPQAAVTEGGSGWVTSELSTSHQLDALVLSTNSAPIGVVRIDSLPNGSAADAAPTAGGVYPTMIAWQQTPGSEGPAEIRMRYASAGDALGPEAVVSDPALGPTDADLGLVDGVDLAGDAAIAWVQGTGASAEIVAAQLSQTPGNFAPAYASHYWASAYPTLSWSIPAESWGPLTYSLTFDGQPLGQTPATTLRPGPFANGRHVWQVSATNQAGLTVTARSASVFVDTSAPRPSMRLRGVRIVGERQTLAVSAIDPPPPGQPSAAASGVVQITVRWGDGTVRRVSRTSATITHVYRRRGSDTVLVTARDRAGNRTTISRRLTIRPKPKPKPKPKKAKPKKTKTKKRTPSTRERAQPTARSGR